MRGWAFKADVTERARRLEWWSGKLGRAASGPHEVWCLSSGWWEPLRVAGRGGTRGVR